MSVKQIFDHNNIVITGGAGFIGSHLCESLVKKNKIICIDNLSTGNEKNIDFLLRHPNFEFVNHDITKPIVLEDLPGLKKFKVRWQGIQEIYHLACPASPSKFDELGVDVLLASSEGTRVALDLANKYKSKFLYMSSSVVYGDASPGSKIRESFFGAVNQLGLHNSYVEGKRFAESLVDNYRKKYNLDTRIARVFTTYGPRMSLSDGRIISKFVSQAMDGKDLVIRGDQNAKNSFCYVDDVIEGTLRVMNYVENTPINIGSSDIMPVIELAKRILVNTKSDSQIVFKDLVKGSNLSHIPDISFAKENLGWEPVIMLDRGIEKTLKYLKASRSLLGFSDGGIRKI